MKFAKSLLMGIGSLVVAGLMFTVLAPKSVHALVATAVQVMNTAANPVPNKDVDQPGRHAFAQSCSTTSTFFCALQPAVPSGSVFVVQTLVGFQVLTGSGPAGLQISTNTNGVANNLILPATVEPNNLNDFITLANLTLYLDPGTASACGALAPVNSFSCYVSGHLVTVP